MGDIYALVPLENQLWVNDPSIFAKKCRLSHVNILNLAKKDCMAE